MEVTWFRHNHEDRADLLRFGLMRMHYAGEIRYRELTLGDAGRFGFTHSVLNYPDHRHLSFLLVNDRRRPVRCLVDNEDSFALISPLITEVDICFCAGYNSDMFEHQQFVKPYAWQTEEEIAWYRRKIGGKIELLGPHFSKIKRFVPPTTNMRVVTPTSKWSQKWKNAGHKLRTSFRLGEDFSDVYKKFLTREAQLNALRDYSLEYDVVLRDTLWGWPRHRVNLHRQLQKLHQEGYQVNSSLTWVEPMSIDGGAACNLQPSAFPICTGTLQETYEHMLAQSRLAVLACGFHWGWRSVMMLALGIGLPVLTDRLLTEAHFDINEFELIQCEDNSWVNIGKHLQDITQERWREIKEHNTAVYDKYMRPEAVARYFLSQAQTI